MGSTLYESWITRLRISWMGVKARQIFGGFAAALGDKSVDWARQGLLEHMPGYAKDPASIALIANERQLDTYPGEPSADIAARAPYWLEINKFRGRGLGILLGLHFAGFDDAVVVQQNGRALQLTLPLPPFTGNWDPTPNRVVTACSQLATSLTSSVHPPTTSSAGKTAPAGHAWWLIDDDTEYCSRFVVLFPTPPASYPFSAADLARLKATVVKWLPRKSKCVGVYVCSAGKFMGWPVQPQSANTMGAATIANVTGSL